MKRFFLNCQLLLALVAVATPGICQTDTEFWFVAPEVTQGNYNYDRPTLLRFAAYSQPATVTVSMPAQPSFPVQTLNVGAQSGATLNLGPWIGLLENAPPDVVLNAGIRITATEPIAAYYEVAGANLLNPEIFVLKGCNALGNSFVIPFQNGFGNSTQHFPLPRAAFDIVATEDNTVVTITPSQLIVGHAANVPFTVTLNRGQTYSAAATGQTAAGHPSGSIVTATHPIAITIKDDLLQSAFPFNGDCRDLTGDQLVPVSKTGRRFVVQKGNLNALEKAYIVPTAANTQLWVDGNILPGPFAVGQTLPINIIDAHFLEATEPVYVLQLSGTGCEFASALVPGLDNAGSTAVQFVRTTNEDFVIRLVTADGNQNGFTLNGNPIWLPGAAFAPVPGSGGEFVSATFTFNTTVVATGASTSIANSSGKFQMSFINGAPSATGCRMGYFSDFLSHVLVDETHWLCPGEEMEVGGQWYTAPDTVWLDGMVGSVCDTLYRVLLKLKNVPPETFEDVFFCPGSTVTIAGTTYNQPGTVSRTYTAQNGCDSIVHYELIHSGFIEAETTIAFCPGEAVIIGGQAYSEPGIVLDTVAGLNDCDTIWSITLLHHPAIPGFLPADTTVCADSPLLVNSPYPLTWWQNDVTPSPTYTVSRPGRVMAYVVDSNGCPGRDTIDVAWCCGPRNTYVPNVFSPNDDGYNDEFCAFTAGECTVARLEVYDRWGELLFRSSTNNTCWDGYYRGKPAVPGVYVWLLHLTARDEAPAEVLKGDVTVVR